MPYQAVAKQFDCGKDFAMLLRQHCPNKLIEGTV